MDLEDKVALVTGGASGIGKACAERLRAEGCRVVIADIDAASGEALADRLGARFCALDVADPAQWTATVAEISKAEGRLDITLLNAGISTLPSDRANLVLRSYGIADLDLDAYRRIMGVNVDGVVFGVRAAMPAMRASGGGAIVATASLAGLMPFAADPIYTLTKHAVVGLVRALAEPLAAEGIRIHAVCPAVVDTAILGPNGGDRVRSAGIPVIEPSAIAGAVVEAISSTEPGGLYTCTVGAPAKRYTFAPPPPIIPARA